MLTIGDAFAALAVQAARPRIEGVDLQACLTRPAEQPDVTKWKAAVWTECAPSLAEPHATVRPVFAAGFSMRCKPREAMRGPDALQGGALCSRNGPQRPEHLKAA